MKFKLLFCLFFLFSYNLISQIKSENFVGRWRLVKKERSTNLITIKKDTQGYGITIHLLKNGNIRETFSAPCGNDPRFFTSAKKGIGSWSYNDNNKTHNAIYGTFGCCPGNYFDFQRMIRKDGYKLMLFPKNKRIELYNLNNDPYELNNFADNSKYELKVKDLYKELIVLQAEMGDTLNLNRYFKNNLKLF